jgi:nicotinamidase-related amidase
VHCLEGDPRTELAVEQLKITDADYTIKKRRYSAFYGTDLEILLKGLKAETLILCGGLTDVCVHYTFADAHQMDYYTRVVEDCVAGSGDAAHQASLSAMEYLQTGARCSSQNAQAAFTVFGKDHS